MSLHHPPLASIALAMKAIGDRIEKIQLFLGFLFILCFLSVVFIDVLFRETGNPILWTEEIARFTYMWAVFFGSGIALRRGGHFKIDILTGNIRGKARIVIGILEFIFISIFVGILLIPGFDFAMMGLHRISNPSEIPLIFSTACIPLSALFMAYYMVERLVTGLARDSIPRQGEHGEDGRTP